MLRERKGREEQMERKEKGTHNVVIPYPFAGPHKPNAPIPQASFAFKALLRISLLATESSLNSMQTYSKSDVHIHSLPDPPRECEKLESMDAYFHHLKAAVSHSLPDIIQKNRNVGYETKFVVYESMMPWGLDVVTEFGVQGAPFLTQSCSILALYYHLHQATISIPLVHKNNIVLAIVPPPEINDMPSYFSVPGSYPDLLKILLDQISYSFSSQLDLLQLF